MTQISLLGSYTEGARGQLYSKIEEFSRRHSCLGRLSCIVVIPINIISLACNVLKPIIEAIISIWNRSHDPRFKCNSSAVCRALGDLVAACLQTVVFAPLEGTVGIIYDVCASLIYPEGWAYRRKHYHRTIARHYREDKMLDAWGESFFACNLIKPCQRRQTIAIPADSS